ncbi:MAG: hypothetical protein IPK85_04065 [Gemmatimonadetes bacterium]|nr:hypothetical protein [Gemmatimonadota bacterium]
MTLMVGVAIGTLCTLLAVGISAWLLSKWHAGTVGVMLKALRVQGVEWQRLCRQNLTNTPELESQRRDDEAEAIAAANPPGTPTRKPAPEQPGTFTPFDVSQHTDSLL